MPNKHRIVEVRPYLDGSPQEAIVVCLCGEFLGLPVFDRQTHIDTRCRCGETYFAFVAHPDDHEGNIEGAVSVLRTTYEPRKPFLQGEPV